MARYIDADMLMEQVKAIHMAVNTREINSDYDTGFHSATSQIQGLIASIPTADVVEVPENGIGELSDGYHTLPDKAWKSKLHDTGDMYDGMFIVGVETPNGQATYHYDINPYWDMFRVKELEKAPKWDGHTPADAINRIANLSSDVVEVKHGYWKEIRDADGYLEGWMCECGRKVTTKEMFCPSCGVKMDGRSDT